MYHSTLDIITTTSFASTTSTGTTADTRPRAASSAAQRSTSSEGTAARAAMKPAAGLRNLASRRRTTGTKPAMCPSRRARNASPGLSDSQKGGSVNSSQVIAVLRPCLQAHQKIAGGSFQADEPVEG